MIQRKRDGFSVHRLQKTSCYAVQSTHFHRRRLRHFVWVVLFAWVFAMGAGVANACLVALPGSAPAGHENHRHVHESPGHGHAPAVPDGDQEGHAHEPRVDPAKTSCLKFCDDESSALSQCGGSWFDVHPADVLLGGLQIRLAPIADARARRSLESHRAQGPPLVIRLLRLTL